MFESRVMVPSAVATKYYVSMKSILYSVIVLCAVCASAQPIVKTMKRLPDTGQTKSYTDTFGEDNDYTINPLFIVKNNNGTAIDTVTGLMWQATDGGEMTFEKAQMFCDTLLLGGFRDWRMPTPHELFNLFNHQNSNPPLDATVFSKTGAEYWWSGIKQINDASRVWVTNAGGGVGNHPKSEALSAGGTKKIHVRAVRDVEPPTIVQQRFVVLGDGTVFDSLTNLTWQTQPSASAMNWEEALSYAEKQTVAGKTDWRLPNIKELYSLHSLTDFSPAVDKSVFPNIGITKLWSSTSLPNQTVQAWYWDTNTGLTTHVAKTSMYNVLCVRGGTEQTTDVAQELKQSFNTVYNSSNDALHLHFSTEGSSFSLYNIVGELLVENCKSQMFAMQQFPQGLYVIVEHPSNSVVLFCK